MNADKYCGVKLNVAGFEKGTLQRLGQINQTKLLCYSKLSHATEKLKREHENAFVKIFPKV